MSDKLDANRKEAKLKKVKKYLPYLGDGQWQLEDLIGRGGGGSVFRVYHGTGRNRVEKAVKLITIDAHYVKLADWDARLQRGEITGDVYDQKVWDAINNTIPELRFMALLSSSPHVLGYEDYRYFKTQDDNCWNVIILMDLLKPLAQHLMRPGADQLDVLHMWRDLGQVLVMCAQLGVLHLDIKDANILVTSEGRYKLIDWGQACFQNDIQRLINEKRSVRFGTESYMAPEVYHNDPPVAYDERADIYSLGIVVYYYFNGMRLPFADKPWTQLSEEERERVKRRRLKGNELLPCPEGLERDIWRVLERACAYAPADRYATAAELVREVENLIAVRSPNPKKTGKKGAVIGTFAAALVLSAAVWMGRNLLFPGDPRQTYTPTPPPALASPTVPASTVAPTPTPTPDPTPTPTPEPSPTPTPPLLPTPTPEPTPTPTPTPTPEHSPSPTPTPEPTPVPLPDTALQMWITSPMFDDQTLDLRSGSSVKIAGMGEPDREILILLDGTVIAQTATDRRGAWEANLNSDFWQKNELLALSARYTMDDEGLKEVIRNVCVDTYNSMPVITGTVDENTEVLTGIVEKGAEVYILLSEKRISAEVNDSGVFTALLPLLIAGEELTVVSTDSAFNEARCVITVEQGLRSAVTIADLPQAQRPAQNFELSGTAAAYRSVRVTWTAGDQQQQQLVQVDAEGTWSTVLDLSQLQHASVCAIVADYSDRLTPELSAEATVVIDSLCELTVGEALNEDMVSLEGVSESSAEIQLQSSEGWNFIQRTDDTGKFKFDHLVLKAGEILRISARDSLGNTSEWTGRVQPGDRADIALEVQDLQNGYLNAMSQQINLYGTGQPDKAIALNIADKSMEVQADEQGAFKAVIPIVGFAEGMIRIHAAYADGFCEECAQTIEIVYDNTLPPLTVNERIGGTMLESTLNVVSGMTEPGAVIKIHTGESMFETTADQSGVYTFENMALLPDTTVQIVSQDQAGNETEIFLSVVDEIRDAKVQIDRPAQGETVINGRLGVSANILLSGSTEIYYVVEHGSETVLRHDVTQNELREMKESDFQKKMEQYVDLIGRYTGYSIRQSLEIPSDQLGEYTISFYSDDLDDVPVLLASQHFSNGESEPINPLDDKQTQEAVDDLIVRDTYAFGLDPQKSSAFAPDQVYFTGWYWSKRRDGLYIDVIVDGERYTQQELKAAGGGVTVGRSRRAIKSEYPDLVPDVTPAENTAGVVIMLNLSFLPAGKHEVQLVMIYGSEEQYMTSKTVELSEQIASDPTLLRTLQNEWK